MVTSFIAVRARPIPPIFAQSPGQMVEYKASRVYTLPVCKGTIESSKL
jgi:hypothetical protein